MKKILLTILVLFMVFIPLSVKAESKIYFETDTSNISPGKTKKINILVDSDEDFTKVNFDLITTSSYIGFYSVNFEDSFKRNQSSSSDYELEAKTPQKSGTVIGTVTLVAKEDAPIGVEGYIRITKASIMTDSLISLSNAQVKMSVTNQKSTNNNLSSLTSTIVDLKFDKDVLEYTVTVDDGVDSLDLIATPEDSSATVTISDQSLKKSNNVIEVVVEAEDGSKKTYKVNVKKGEAKQTIVDSDADEVSTSNKGVKNGWGLITVILLVILVLDILYIKKKK